MKEYICIKDFYIEDVKFASVGDHVILLPDGSSVVNNNGHHKTVNMPNIVNDLNHFIPTFEVVQSKGKSEEAVNHPSHYTWLKEKCGIEVIDITRHMDFNLGNSIKYILRAGHKSEVGLLDKEKQVEDLKKAVWYLNDKINMLENE